MNTERSKQMSDQNNIYKHVQLKWKKEVYGLWLCLEMQKKKNSVETNLQATNSKEMISTTRRLVLSLITHIKELAVFKTLTLLIKPFIWHFTTLKYTNWLTLNKNNDICKDLWKNPAIVITADNYLIAHSWHEGCLNTQIPGQKGGYRT